MITSEEAEEILELIENWREKEKEKTMTQTIECGKDSKIPDSGSLKFLIYGSSGVGKTFALRTLPESMRPALILDTDRGSRALWKEEGLGTIATFDIMNKGKPVLYTQAMSTLQDMHSGKFNGIEYNTVVVDSYTVMHQAITSYVMHKSLTGTGDKKLNRSTMDEPPTLPEYGIIGHLALKFIEALIQLNQNLVVICHETAVVTDEVSGQTRGGPALPPKLASQMPRYFDEVLYAKAKGKGSDRKYTWATRSTGLFEARTRYHELDDEIEQDFNVYEKRSES